MVEKGQKVLVTEGRIKWEGTYLWAETGFADQLWAVVQPQEYTVHVRRGSGSTEYSQNLVRVPLFLDTVVAI